MGRLAITFCLLIIGNLAFQPSSEAGPFRTVGYDSISVGTANNQHTFGFGLGVLYTNPALLTELEPQFGIRLLLIQPELSATLMPRPINADIPMSFYDSDVGIQGANLDRPLPTAELPNPRHSQILSQPSAYLGIGLVHSLGIDDFRLGINIQIPTSGLLSLGALYPDEREQYFDNTVHFTRFGEWDQLITMQLGIAWRPFSWLSIGASLEGALKIAADLDVYIPEANVQSYALSNTQMHTTTSYRGVIGLMFRPLDLLRFSLVFRDRRYNKVNAVASLKLWNYHESGDTTIPKRVVQHHMMALDFEPMELTLAAGLDLSAWKIEISTTWNHWSDYLDPHHQRAQQSAVFEPVNPGDVLIDGSAFAFFDTFSFAASVSWTYLPGFMATLGCTYRPTPVPAQTGRTNYVDNDLLGIALGHRFDLTLFQKRILLDLGLQFWKMLDSTVYKDPTLIRDEFPDRAQTLIGAQPMPEAEGLQTNNPGFPGYQFGGFSLIGSVSMAYLF